MGIRGLLRHVGLDVTGKTITVDGEPVDSGPAPTPPAGQFTDAVDQVARQVLAQMVNVDRAYTVRGEYLDLDDVTWDAVEERVVELGAALWPSRARHDAAYRYLAHRPGEAGR